jgi:hypothetical protein
MADDLVQEILVIEQRLRVIDSIRELAEETNRSELNEERRRLADSLKLHQARVTKDQQAELDRLRRAVRKLQD